MTKDIAVIGMSGRFPEAANIREFYQNLRNGRDSVKKMSKERIQATNLEDKDYRILGFIEDVDKFDHKLFNISLVEAQHMDPNQKIALELVYEAFENAGYNPEHFNGSRTAVIVGNTDYHYYRHIDHFEPTMYSGNTHFSTAGRISRQFNLFGSGAVIDTGCSSALISLHFACKELWSGDADYAIACGHKLILFPAENKPLTMDVGITSRDGKTRSFADNSYGSGGSETIAAVLLKPLDKAIEDKDIVYAVIKASAANQNGQLSGSITATSSAAQANLIKDAWRKAGIDPMTISFIEAHGSGTQLGDPIEIGGINQAYKGVTDRKKHVAVSSVKSNIGHTDTAAGIAGFVKTVLSIKHRELFPSLHFDKPNPFIDFENSVAYINTELKAWNPESGVLRAGVSSFGFAGNNCHMILEEPPVPKDDALQPGKPYLVTLSSKRKGGAKANASAILDFIEDKAVNIAGASYTLNTGRQHFGHRFAAVVNSEEELRKALKSFVSTGEEHSSTPIGSLMFIFSDSSVSADLITSLSENYPVFREIFHKVLSKANAADNINVVHVAFQLAMCDLLASYGLQTSNLLGIGVGDITTSILLNEMSLEEGVKAAEMYVQEPISDMKNRLVALVERESENGKVGFVELGSESEFSEGLKSLVIRDKEELYSSFTVKNEEDPLLALFRDLYLANYAMDWNGFYRNQPKPFKVELPGYQFEKIRCWIKEPGQITSSVTGTGPLSESSEAKSRDDDKKEEPAVALTVNESWTPAQRKVAKIWGQVLKLDTVNLDDDFFKLGGHSLFGVQVTNRIEKEFGVKLMFKDILTFSTIRLLARGVEMLQEKSGGNAFRDIRAAGKRESYVLSHSQKRLWVINEMEGANLAYNLPAALFIKGDLDRKKLEDTFRRLIERHEILRTSFLLEEGGPVQRVHDNVDFSVEFFTVAEKDIDAKVKSFVRPFDLAQAPLIRVALGTIAPGKHILLYDLHHIVCDGASGDILNTEFVNIYLGENLAELKIQYKDYAVWQQEFLQSSTLKDQESYWLEQFREEVPALQLPLDHPRPESQSFEGAGIDFTLDEKITSRLRELSGKTGATLYMLLLSAYNVLLHKNSGQEDIVVGSPIAGRNHSDVEGLIGLFVNMLPYRNRPAAGKKFSDFLQEVKQTCLAAYENQDYPFEALVDKLDLQRDMSRNPLFDTMFLFHNTSSAEQREIAGLSFSLYRQPKATTQFDLTLEVKESERTLDLRLEYCSRLFDPATIARMQGHFLSILDQVLDNPDVLISGIAVLSASERSQLLEAYNTTETSPELYNTTLPALFAKQVAEAPSAVALLNGNAELTYLELDQLSGRAANAILERINVKKGDVIALFMDRSEWMAASMLGILKAGAAYLPIEPAYPQERIRYMLADSGAVAVLCDPGYNSLLKTLGTAEVIDTAMITATTARTVVPAVSPEDLAYVIYTSGSTGMPKGVMISHRGIVNRISWMKSRYAFVKGSVVLQKTPYVFDVSVWEFFMTLCYGGKLVVCSRESSYDPASLVEMIESTGITHIHFVPGMLNSFLSVLKKSDRPRLGSLRHVFASGEVLQASTVQKFYKLINARLHNLYGPTEASVDVSHYETSAADTVIPIGRPIDNIRLYVLDNQLMPVPSGVTAELCIAGVGVAEGYINNPALTQEKFVADPYTSSGKLYRTGDLARWNSKGELEFIGRADQQVKIRGYRIELGEIESAISGCEEIKEVVVSAFTEKDGNKALCAYIVSSNAIDAENIREQVARRLPEYMIPAYFIKLDKLPLSHNGKLERSKLPLPGSSVETGRPLAAPSNPTEEKLLSIFRDVLEVADISVDQSFFELGGHSLKAAMLALKIGKAFDTSVPLRQIFKTPTIRGLSGSLNNKNAAAEELVQSSGNSGLYPASFQQRRLYISTQAEGAEKSYNMPVAVEIEGAFDTDRAEAAFRTLVKRHESFRTSFEMRAGELFQRIHPAESVSFSISRMEQPGLAAEQMLRGFVRPFDLDSPLLLRVAVNKMSEDRFLLLLDMHHIISDGASTGILFREFVEIYTGGRLDELTFQYRDYAAWQHSVQGKARLQVQESFWLNRFLSRDDVPAFPTDHPRTGTQTFEGYRLFDSLGTELSERLRRMALENGVTPYMLLLGAYKVLLSKYSGAGEIVVGTPVAGRTLEETESLIGMFVNMIPLKIMVDKETAFMTLLSDLREVCISSFDNQDYPYEMLVEKLGIAQKASNPLFDTVFVFQNTPMKTREIEGLKFRPLDIEPGVAKFDLTFELVDRPDEVDITVEYNTSLYSRASVEKLKNDYIALLGQLAGDPGIKISDIEVSHQVNLIEGSSIGEFDFKDI